MSRVDAKQLEDWYDDLTMISSGFKSIEYAITDHTFKLEDPEHEEFFLGIVTLIETMRGRLSQTADAIDEAKGGQ